MDETRPAGYRKIHVFPGVEITAYSNIHVLGIFDPRTNTKDIQALLGAVGFPAAHFGTSDAVAQKTCEEVIREIHKQGGVAIPAHVDKACGLFKLTGHTLTQALKADGLLAMELIDVNVDKHELYKQSKLSLTEIVGSDSHSLSEIGTNYTWVKMGAPSIDALKLALHDGEDGSIRKEHANTNPNSIANRYFIKSISVSNGYKAGNGVPLKAEFSPWLSSLIGGRGSGKSTIVNYLRIALAKTKDMPREVQEEFDKFNQVGRKSGTGMLRDTTVITVEIFKDGKLQQLTFENASQKFKLKSFEEQNGWSTETEVTTVQDLFPVQIFSQKELYSLTGNPSKLLELIDSQFDKPFWTARKDELVSQWLATRARQRQLKASVREEGNVAAQLDSVNNKIGVFESSEYKDTLNDFKLFNLLNQFFIQSSSSVVEFVEKLKDLESKTPVIKLPENFDDIVDGNSKTLISDANQAINDAKDGISKAVLALTAYVELYSKLTAFDWSKKYEDSKIAYAKIVDKIKELGSETYESLIQRRNDLQEKQILIERQKTELQGLSTELKKIYDRIVENEKELRKQRIEIINRWKDFSQGDDPFLLIELLSMGDGELANSSFRKLIRKEGTEFTDHIYQYDDELNQGRGLIHAIINENESDRWDKRLAVIKELVTANDSDKKRYDLRFIKHISSLNSTSPEDIDRLYIWFPEDKVVLKFKKGEKIQDIQAGSAGERTAGMLGLLMALNDMPLIIDQPEDDLDTSLISNFVVPGFKKLKKTRQLVLVTHNPNITVNGNSDNIVHMNYVNGQISVAANNALQNKNIREAVCEVMEGGRDALDKRYYRISRALSPAL